MGYPNSQIGTYWESKACGIACVRMIIEGLTGTEAPKEFEIIKSIGWRGGYIPGRGWVHKSLIAYAERFGIIGKWSHVTSSEEICSAFAGADLAIASVSVGLDPKVKGGHLVVILGCSPSGVQIHHPSSDESYEHENWNVDWQRFMSSFSGALMTFRKI